MELLSYRNKHSAEPMAFKELTVGINWEKKSSKEHESQGRYKVKAAFGRKLNDRRVRIKRKNPSGSIHIHNIP